LEAFGSSSAARRAAEVSLLAISNAKIRNLGEWCLGGRELRIVPELLQLLLRPLVSESDTCDNCPNWYFHESPLIRKDIVGKLGTLRWRGSKNRPRAEQCGRKAWRWALRISVDPAARTYARLPSISRSLHLRAILRSDSLNAGKSANELSPHRWGWRNSCFVQKEEKQRERERERIQSWMFKDPSALFCVFDERQKRLSGHELWNVNQSTRRNGLRNREEFVFCVWPWTRDALSEIHPIFSIRYRIFVRLCSISAGLIVRRTVGLSEIRRWEGGILLEHRQDSQMPKVIKSPQTEAGCFTQLDGLQASRHVSRP